MSRKEFHRRDMIRLAIGAGGMLASSRAFGQTDALTQLLGDKMPKELLQLLPAKPVNMAKTIAAILALEKEADARNFRKSALAFNQGKEIPAFETSLYQSALPRLVTLIDRSEGEDEGMADRAGAILADVHATQHETPEALRTEPLPLPAPVSAPVAVPAPPIPLSRRHDYATLKPEYARMFGSVQLRAEASDTANWYARMMRNAKSRYERVATEIGVPWHFIAATHALEASFNFRAHLHNGDFPLTARTRQVPSGRPTVWLPPSNWEASAKDAMRLLGFTGQSDWSLERTLYRLEAYNGFGYRKRGVPTPYLWSFSNHYERGKFVSDGSFNPKARSQQCGAAVMLKLLVESGDAKFG